MAARLNTRHTEQTLKAIKTTQLVKRLAKQALGEIKMDANQIRATEILLRKSLPDLKATEVTNNTPVKNVFVFADNTKSVIEGSVVSPNTLEHADQGVSLGSTEIVEHSASEAVIDEDES